MKLSRLTNRQLRSLLRRGEVRFADDEKEIVKKAILKHRFDMFQTFMSSPYILGDSLGNILIKKYPKTWKKYLAGQKIIKNELEKMRDLVNDIDNE